MPIAKKIEGSWLCFFTAAKAANYGTAQDEMHTVTDEEAHFIQDHNGIVERTTEGVWQVPQPPQPTLDELKQAAKYRAFNRFSEDISGGFAPQGKDFVLACYDGDQTQFNKAISVLNEGLALGQLTLESNITGVLYDRNGVPLPVMTLGEIKAILFAYGMYIVALKAELAETNAQIDACTTAEELQNLTV